MFPTIKTGEGGSPLSGGMETLQQFHQQTISESIQFPAFYYGEMQSRKSEMNYLKNEIIRGRAAEPYLRDRYSALRVF